MIKDNTPDEFEFLGVEVKVVVDRPIRSLHPEHGFKYEVNYGFVPNTVGGDGEEIDAYIIGESDQLKQFTGIVKAVIIRENDVENKLVVVKSEYQLEKSEVRKLTHFQEKFFNSEIVLLK